MSLDTPKDNPDESNELPHCYIMISCGEPSPDGQMNVEMSYQGDKVLISYLLQQAQALLDKEEETQAKKYSTPREN